MEFFYGRVVLITGASSGIGRVCAQMFSKNGYKVYGTSRRVEEGAEETISEYENGGFFKLIHLDVNNPSSAQNAIVHITKKEGHIGILINNAGFGIAGPVEGTSLEEAKEQFDTNFFGVLTMCREVMPVMRSKERGLIINISSVAAPITIPFQTMYSASKSALESLSEGIRMECAPYGIKVSVIQPGDTKTEFTRSRRFVKGTEKDSVYYKRLMQSVKTMEEDEKNGCEPEVVGKAVLKVARKKNPPVKVATGFKYKLIVLLKRFIPDKIYLYIVSRLYA